MTLSLGGQPRNLQISAERVKLQPFFFFFSQWIDFLFHFFPIDPLHRLQGHTDVVSAACWLGQSKTRLVTGSWDQTLLVWDIGDEKATQIQKLTGHEKRVTHVDTHPKEEIIVSSSKDSTFRVWDPRRSGVALSVFHGQSHGFNSAIFSPIGNYVISSSQELVKVWDLRSTKAPATIIRCGSTASKISISNTGTIAAPLDNGDIRLYDLSGGLKAKIGKSYPVLRFLLLFFFSSFFFFFFFFLLLLQPATCSFS